jgi:hypothetical protein
VLEADSGESSFSSGRGTNQSNEPWLWQIEQLQATTYFISPSTSNETFPQWQLPWYFIEMTFQSDGWWFLA